MKRRTFLALYCVFLMESALASELNYDELIHLDAESLAETGIAEAYEELAPLLRKYVSAPAAIKEQIDNDSPSYSVSCLGTDYFIYGGENQNESWMRATFAFFDIVNRQLADTNTKYRFFAFYGGNDLGGMFLTPEQVEDAKKSIPRKEDWPYLPTMKAPRYGQFH